MAGVMPPHPLARIIDQFKREPSRTGSLIITVYGDAIVPRGGAVWLGTLLAFFKTLDIDGSVVRTAASRLAADGWLSRARVGRNSFYRLADKGRETFAAASRHIYAAGPPHWTGRFDLLLLPNGAGGRDGLRDSLRHAGFGNPLPGLWLAPSGTAVPEGAADAIRLEAMVPPAADEAGSGRRLIAASWQLERTADAYRLFVATFAPLQAFVRRADHELSDSEAFTARILLIHQYRRIVLRDPLLPEAMLPPDWPGTAARALCAEIYPALLEASERWLDANAVCEAGPLPAPRELLGRRFRA
jgi:phenylacetic acid degradation operon negative regulatory protein